MPQCSSYHWYCFIYALAFFQQIQYHRILTVFTASVVKIPSTFSITSAPETKTVPVYTIPFMAKSFMLTDDALMSLSNVIVNVPGDCNVVLTIVGLILLSTFMSKLLRNSIPFTVIKSVVVGL